MHCIEEHSFNVQSKEDLYVTIRVQNMNLYPCMYSCQPCTFESPFSYAKTLDVFKYYLDLLSDDEVMTYRDNIGGNILNKIAECGKGIEYFAVIYDRVGDKNFKDLLLQKDRSGTCPLVEIQDLDTARQCLFLVGVNGDVLRQMYAHTDQSVLDFIASLINDHIKEHYNQCYFLHAESEALPMTLDPNYSEDEYEFDEELCLRH